MRAIVAIVALLFLGIGNGEAWTVQTAAFQDHRQATAQVEELRQLGFDAYSEFAMNDGQQYSRVRVGCFTSRSAASSFARDIRGRVTADAVAQPLSVGANVVACIGWDTGFVKPQRWQVERTANDIAFRVEVGGQVGFLQHDGAGWRFAHTLAPEPQQAAENGRFREATVGAARLVRARLTDGTEVNVCGGSLLWQDGLTAVVERTNTVIACVVDESGRDGAP